MTADARVIEALADENAELRADLVAYRELAQQAIHALHEVVPERDRLRKENRELGKLRGAA